MLATAATPRRGALASLESSRFGELGPRFTGDESGGGLAWSSWEPSLGWEEVRHLRLS